MKGASPGIDSTPTELFNQDLSYPDGKMCTASVRSLSQLHCFCFFKALVHDSHYCGTPDPCNGHVPQAGLS